MRFKISFYMLFFTFLIYLFKMPIYAAEKELNVNLSKDAGVAIFYFDFDLEQDYEITITRPNGELISQSISGTNGMITILDPQAGNYAILITADGEIAVSAKVEVQSNMSTALIESGVTISSSITGLSLYFVDGNIAGKWNDTNLGKINITVTNPKNMQILHSVTVEGNEFLLNLPEDVQDIEVYLVPASSAKVSGAGVTYTLPVIRNLDADIHLPENNLTNMDSATIEASLGESYQIEVIENNIVVYQEELPAGRHEIEIPLNSVDNSIIVYVRDGEGNTSSYSGKIQKDIIAPTLNLSESYDNMHTSNEEIELSGTVLDGDFLFVNGEEVDISSNGKFMVSCLLEEGENEIIICAKDLANNESIVKVRIVRKSHSYTSSLVCIGVIVITCFLIGGLLKKKRDAGISKREEKRDSSKVMEQKIGGSAVLLKEPRVEKCIKKKRRVLTIATLFNTAIAIASIYILVHICFFETYVASGSMEPTLKTGNIVIYNKLYYITRDYSRGDIVCFWSDIYNGYIAKRIIGLPGDEIEFHDGFLFINGSICKEEYIPEGVETNSLKSFSVPEGHVFILGDNRENSVDSRHWETPYIDMKYIVGKYFGTITNPLTR